MYINMHVNKCFLYKYVYNLLLTYVHSMYVCTYMPIPLFKCKLKSKKKENKNKTPNLIVFFIHLYKCKYLILSIS